MNNVQKALTNAIHMIDVLQTSGLNLTPEGDKVKADLKAALSEIEKCEPVAYLKFISRQWLVSPEIGMDGFQGFEVCDKDEKGDDGSDAIAVFTSPQPCDWVGLSDDELLAIAEIDAADHWYFEVCKRVSEKLKQLNTKG